MTTEKGQQLYTHAKERIPGGVQLLSKRPEMFAPGKWPSYAVRAQGCKVWDLDGNCFTDVTTSGIGSCLLGYADPDVTAAVTKRIANGSMTNLCAPEEVYLADRLCEIHPWAEQVRFARTGGESCAVAVRIARATTGRDLVAISGYHGWSDWYLSANLSNDHQLDGQLLPGLKPAGVPSQLTGTAHTFFGGDKESFDALIREHGHELACVIMEPMRTTTPPAGFLEHVRKETSRVGALLIFDEITIGWRYTFGGCHKVANVTPDIAVFAKALGNGHPIAAVIGTKAAMEGAHDSFISSTYWTEAVGPTAALTTLDKMEKTRVWEHVHHAGTVIQQSFADASARHGIPVRCSGFPCLTHCDFTENSPEMKTLFIRLMLEEGFLTNTTIYPSLAHTDEVLAQYAAALDTVFAKMADILKRGGIEALREILGDNVCQAGFKRLLK